MTMANIDAKKLIQLFQQALDEHWGYIWGAAGEKWTQEKQDAATRDMTVKYGQQWVGKYVADCSGLFYWVFKKLGGYMYHGSNTMWSKYCTSKGALKNGARSDGQILKPGSAVFKCKNGTDYYHVGLYIGNNTVIEAQGTSTGVVTSKLSTWTHWGELKGINYGSNTEVSYTALGQRVLKNTSPDMQGEDIKILQTKLNTLGYSCGNPDGYFGTKTEKALITFQKANGLKADGIFDADDLAALNNGGKASETMQTYTVVAGDTLGKIAKKLLGKSGRYKEIMEANGMTSTMIKPGMILKIPV